jgi:hypothetical protein
VSPICAALALHLGCSFLRVACLLSFGVVVRPGGSLRFCGFVSLCWSNASFGGYCAIGRVLVLLV